MCLTKCLKPFALLLSLFVFGFAGAQSISEEMEAIADIIVDINGTGDYTTVQQGLSAVPDSSDDWTVVYVKNGFYYEKIILRPQKMKVVLVGESADSTILSYDDHADAVLPGHTFSSYSFRADAHDFQAYNITFQNTNDISQAVAYHSNGDRQILYHCRLVGNQDTYFDNFRTRRYMKDTYIEGDVDFIFGFGVTLFDSCQIHINDPGYITAAATPEHYEFGYVFKNCYMSVREGGFWKVSLGRPWFPYSNTIFFECYMPPRITAPGWSPWGGREQTCIYREYNNFGPGADTTFRVSWSSQLDPALAPRYNIDTIFARSNFPYDLGEEVDSIELYSMRKRFEESGYADRADTILYAGRDFYPEYPEADWHPEFYEPVHSIITNYTTPFVNDVEVISSIRPIVPASDYGISVVNPMKADQLSIISERTIPGPAHISLYDMSGKLVYQHRASSLVKGITEIPVPSESLNAGVYVYVVVSGDVRASGKVVKH